MNTFPDELIYEILSHLPLNVIIPLSVISTNFNTFIRDKPFWIIYVSHRSQYQYRQLFDRITKTKYTWLFDILHIPYQDKVLDKCIKEKCYYNAYVNENEIMLKYIGGGHEYIVERRLHKVRKIIQGDYNVNNAKKIMSFHNNISPDIRFKILCYCKSYTDLLMYYKVIYFTFTVEPMVLGVNLLIVEDIDYKELLIEIIKCDSILSFSTKTTDYSFDLFHEIVGSKNIDLIELKKYIFQSPNKEIINYFIEKTNIQFNYENIKEIIEEDLPFKCEYYIIEYYNNNILSEDEETVESLWYILECTHDIIDDDLYIDMIYTLCENHYNKISLESIYDITDDSGYFYINSKIKAIPQKFGKEELSDNWTEL